MGFILVTGVNHPRGYRMTKYAFALFLFLAATLFVCDSQTLPGSYIPKGGFVPNGETAVKIAEAVLIPVYGEQKVLSERPFTAARSGDTWTVVGTLHCSPPGSLCKGGTAEVKISKTSGQILHMIHYK
ncbi:MAG TPA: NTF2 fold immunity protein [Candidatus Angelobacter sp.]